MPINRIKTAQQRRGLFTAGLKRNRALIAQAAQTEKPFQKKVIDLIKLTTSPKGNKRYYAVKELGEMKDPRLAKLFFRLTADRDIYSSVSIAATFALAKLGHPKTPIIANRIAKIVSRSGHNFSFYELEGIYEGIAKAKGGYINNLFSIAKTELKHLPENKRAVFKAAIALGKVSEKELEPSERAPFGLEEDERQRKIKLLFWNWEEFAKNYTTEQLIKRFGF